MGCAYCEPTVHIAPWGTRLGLLVLVCLGENMKPRVCPLLVFMSVSRETHIGCCCICIGVYTLRSIVFEILYLQCHFRNRILLWKECPCGYSQIGYVVFRLGAGLLVWRKMGRFWMKVVGLHELFGSLMVIGFSGGDWWLTVVEGRWWWFSIVGEKRERVLVD